MAKKQDRKSVLEELRKQIELGTLLPGSRLPAERDLASEFSVSRALVRKAIQRLVESGLVEQKPLCRPTVLARPPATLSEASRRFGRVAVWMREDSHDIGSTLILKGIRRVLGESGRELFVSYPSSGDRATVDRFLASIRSDTEIEGVILWASDDEALVPCYRKLIAEGVPLVCIDREPPEPIGADVVAVDHFRGARTATQHLISLGHRRIAMVGNDDRVSSVRDRVDGYFSALRESGIGADEQLYTEVSFVHSDDLAGSSVKAIDRLMALSSPPTAIFTVNDQIAMYLQDALIAKGLDVPSDVSLVGFDWFLRWLPSGGDLTTVAQPFEQIGEVAASRLVERIEGRALHLASHVLLPAPLVVKATTKALVNVDDSLVVK